MNHPGEADNEAGAQRRVDALRAAASERTARAEAAVERESGPLSRTAARSALPPSPEPLASPPSSSINTATCLPGSEASVINSGAPLKHGTKSQQLAKQASSRPVADSCANNRNGTGRRSRNYVCAWPSKSVRSPPCTEKFRGEVPACVWTEGPVRAGPRGIPRAQSARDLCNGERDAARDR